jgi:hypothetical protein
VKWQNKIGLGGLMILGVGFGSQSRPKMGRDEAIGYYGAQTAMLIGGAALIVVGARQRRREMPKPPPLPPTARALPPKPIATVTPPTPPSRDPNDGPTHLG